jgi:hypothetical protein
MKIEKLDSINDPWHLEEYQRSMFYIFDVKNNEDKLVARFVADDENKDALRPIPKLIAKATFMKKVLEGVEQDIVMNNGNLTAETFDAVKAINQELEG